MQVCQLCQHPGVVCLGVVDANHVSSPAAGLLGFSTALGWARASKELAGGEGVEGCRMQRM